MGYGNSKLSVQHLKVYKQYTLMLLELEGLIDAKDIGVMAVRLSDISSKTGK